MEADCSPKDSLSPQEVVELKKLWRGKWLAIVDDDTADPEILRQMFPLSLGLDVLEKNQKESPDSIVMHVFENPIRFLEAQKNSASYDVVVIDGRLGGPDSLTGPKVVARIQPGTIIIGRSAEAGYNDEFRRNKKVTAVIPKRKDLCTSFPEFARVVKEEDEEDID